MSAYLLPQPQQFFDNNGDPLAGGKVYTCIAGASGYTKTYQKDSYTDATGLSANPNPVVLDAFGRCNIWGDGTNYKLFILNSSDILIDTIDNIPCLFGAFADITVTPSDGTVTTSKIVDGAVTLDKIASGTIDSVIAPRIGSSGPASDRNKIINGSLQIWQLGTSFTVPAGQSMWTADQISIWNNTNQTLTVTSQSANASGNYVPAMTLSFATAPTSGSVDIAPVIPGVTTLQNSDVTLSYYCATVESLSITSEIFQNFGAEGSALVSTNLPGTVNPTSKLLRYSSTVALPSVIDKTFGANHKIYPKIHIPIRTTNPFTLAMMQLEYGKTATPFEMPSYRDELQRCLPFVQILDSVVILRTLDSANYGGGVTQLCFYPMHHAPSINLTYLEGGNYTLNAQCGLSSGWVAMANPLPGVGAYERIKVTLLARV